MEEEEATSLYDACLRGQLPVVSRLIEAGAGVETRGGATGVGATCLLIATEHESIGVVRHLIASKANPNNAHLEDGFAPLHSAAKNGASDLVHILLQAGASPSIRMTDGTTPLQLARKNGYTDIAEVLLRAAPVRGSKPK